MVLKDGPILEVPRDIVIPPDALSGILMRPRIREVLEYLHDQGQLTLYVGAVMAAHRLEGREIDPIQALEHGVQVLMHSDINSSPVSGDFGRGSHRGALRRLEELTTPLVSSGELQRKHVAGRMGSELHGAGLLLLRGELPGAGEKEVAEVQQDDLEGFHMPPLSLAECVENGRMKESILDQIAQRQIAVVEALSRGANGIWDAQLRAGELYTLLRPLLGKYGERIRKHAKKHIDFVAPTLANLATLVLFTQTPEYEASRLPMFTEIPPILENLSGRADAFVVTGMNGRQLTEEERARVDKLTRSKEFCRGNRSIGNVVDELSKLLGGRVEGMIIDLKNDVGDNFASQRDQLITPDAVASSALPPHIIQVTNYVAQSNLEIALRRGEVSDPHIWPTDPAIDRADLWYLLNQSPGQIIVRTIAPTPMEQQEHFRTHTAQPISFARRQAELRKMLNLLVGQVAKQVEQLQGGKGRKIYGGSHYQQKDLFTSDVTLEEVIEAHRVFTDETHQVEIIGYESNGKPKFLVHWDAVIRNRKERMAAGEVFHDSFSPEGGGKMRCIFPGHNDNGPSMDLDKKRAKCWGIGCHQHGPVYVENEDITGGKGIGMRRTKKRDGVSLLSEDLHEIEVSPEQVQVMGIAQELFRHQFEDPIRGREARAYIAGRNISLATAREFGVGYVNMSVGEFKTYFADRGITREQLIKYNLLAESKKQKDKDYVTLNQRVIFPLALKSNTTSSFYGRSINPNTKMKHYLLNIRDYDLPPHGMAHQKVLLHKPQSVTVTEGVFDAMARYEMGDHNVIPIISTSNDDLTQLILRALPENGVVNLALDYDGNESGQKGTQRIRDTIDAVGFRRKGGHVHDITRIYMRRHPEDKQYKDWHLIWQAHPGMQVI